MEELVRLAYYPFLPEVPEAVRQAGVALPDVLKSASYGSTRARAKQRVLGALESGFEPPQIMDERGALVELLSVPVARMAVVALGDRQLIRRYARAEANNLLARLEQEPDAIEWVLDALEVSIRLGEPPTMAVPDYLQLAPVQNAKWKMLRRAVYKGDVVLSQEDVHGLVAEALHRRIEDELTSELEKPPPAEVHDALEPIVLRLKPALEDAREQWNTGDFGPVQEGLFPPCMKDLFALMDKGQNIPHHGRFAFASFMGTIGLTAEQVMDYLSATPNFDREKSRYQIEHITGERGVDPYTPPGCQSMQTNGICPLDKRDGLCAKIKHPLSYYRAKIKFQKQDAEKAAAAAAEVAAQKGTGQPPEATAPTKEGDA